MKYKYTWEEKKNAAIWNSNINMNSTKPWKWDIASVVYSVLKILS